MGEDVKPRIRGPPSDERKRQLEALLRERPNPDMEVTQFAVVAGLTYNWWSLPEGEINYVRELLRQPITERKRPFSHALKCVETHIAAGLWSGYTIRDPALLVRQIPEVMKERHRKPFYNLSHKGMIYLEKVLLHYGFEPLPFEGWRRTSLERYAREIGEYVPFVMPDTFSNKT